MDIIAGTNIPTVVIKAIILSPVLVSSSFKVLNKLVTEVITIPKLIIAEAAWVTADVIDCGALAIFLISSAAFPPCWATLPEASACWFSAAAAFSIAVTKASALAFNSSVTCPSPAIAWAIRWIATDLASSEFWVCPITASQFWKDEVNSAIDCSNCFSWPLITSPFSS